jgi:hypothetical protein
LSFWLRHTSAARADFPPGSTPRPAALLMSAASHRIKELVTALEVPRSSSPRVDFVE